MQTEYKVMLVLTIGFAIFVIAGGYVLYGSWQEKKIAQCVFTNEVLPNGNRIYKCPDGLCRVVGPNHRNARGE